MGEPFIKFLSYISVYIYIILIINNTLRQVNDFCWTTKPLNAVPLNFLYQKLERGRNNNF